MRWVWILGLGGVPVGVCMLRCGYEVGVHAGVDMR